jgi:hypothetical protein
MHYGVKGMKWGIRRYRNYDGTLTNKGKKRLAKNVQKLGGKHRSRDDIVNEVRKNLNDEIGHIISKESLNKLKKAQSDWSKKDSELESIEAKILAEKAGEVDAEMKKYGLSPDDRHRGYYEEDFIMNDSRYVKAAIAEGEARDALNSIEKSIAHDLIGEYGSQPVKVAEQWASNYSTVEHIIRAALPYEGYKEG